MSWKNPADRWGPVSQLLHWTMVVLIVALAAIGLTMGELANGPTKIRVYALHKSLGISVLALVAIRIAWRLYAGAPRPVAGLPAWQRRIASLTHLALYALLIVMPVSGWVMNSAANFPLPWFGLFNLPRIAPVDPELRALAKDVHENAFWLLMLLAVVHASAAFYHHLFQQDDTLRRMLPRLRRAASQESPHAP